RRSPPARPLPGSPLPARERLRRLRALRPGSPIPVVYRAGGCVPAADRSRTTMSEQRSVLRTRLRNAMPPAACPAGSLLLFPGRPPVAVSTRTAPDRVCRRGWPVPRRPRAPCLRSGRRRRPLARPRRSAVPWAHCRYWLLPHPVCSNRRRKGSPRREGVPWSGHGMRVCVPLKRVFGARTDSAPAGDRPRDARFVPTSFGAGSLMTHRSDSVEGTTVSTDRQSVEQALSSADFPADQAALVEHAQRHSSDAEVLRALRALPPVQYANVGEVLSSVTMDKGTSEGQSDSDKAQEQRHNDNSGLAEHHTETHSNPIVEELGENSGSTR